MTSLDAEAVMEAALEAAALTQQRTLEVLDANPNLPYIAAHVIAADQIGAERWEREALALGKHPREYVWLIGSYARFDYALKHCEPAWVYAHLCELWRGADPDDTSEAALTTWRAAREARGEYLRDGKPLPRTRWLTVYRGQMPHEPIGIAWSLDIDTADKFARGAGVRSGDQAGIVIAARVKRDAVLGFVTGRGESEVIVAPIDVMLTKQVVRAYTKREARAETERRMPKR